MPLAAIIDAAAAGLPSIDSSPLLPPLLRLSPLYLLIYYRARHTAMACRAASCRYIAMVYGMMHAIPYASLPPVSFD